MVFLIDTGATRSLVARSEFEGQEFFRPSDHKLFGVNNEPLEIEGLTDLTLSFNGKKLGSHQFTVVANNLSPFHAILGMDWIKDNDLELLVDGLRIRDQWIPYFRTTNERIKVSCLSESIDKTPKREKGEEYYNEMGTITFVAVVDMEINALMTGTIPIKASTAVSAKEKKRIKNC